MFGSLTFNSIFLMFLGLFLIAAGVYFAVIRRMYPLAVGLISLGSGVFLWGWTDGFTDFSPKGLLFWKLGVLALLTGTLLIGYHFFRTL